MTPVCSWATNKRTMAKKGVDLDGNSSKLLKSCTHELRGIVKYLFNLSLTFPTILLYSNSEDSSQMGTTSRKEA